MDAIVQRYFNKFCIENNLANKNKESVLFEKFANYCVLVNQNIHNLVLSAVETGEGDDCSTDGLAIVINNRLVTNLTELTDIINFRMDIKVHFIFIQTKMSDKFEGTEFLNFGSGVIDIFKPIDQHELRRNDSIQEKCEMIEYIIDNYEILEEPPKCSLFYVCNGKWVEDQNLVARISKVKADFKILDILGEVNFYPVGNAELRRLYEDSKNQNVAELEMDKRIELPYTEGIEEAYLVIMPAKELVSIISDGDELKKGIFDSNIRDFQGYEDNRVNSDINSTINSSSKDKFGFLNNGITIVGKSLTKKRDKYLLKNFQIVNGCQTSNLLFENREMLNDKMWVNVKVIITESEDLINKVVKATNSQTVVEEIHLQAMSDYQLHLESFYKTYKFKGEELFYERRLGQYNLESGIEKNKVVSIEEQIKSFSAVFLDAPHKSSRYYGSLLEDIEKKIFLGDHEPIIYFTSSYMSQLIEIEFLNNNIAQKYRKYKYHILMLIKLIITKNQKIPPFNSKKIIIFCEELLNEVKSNFLELVNESIEILNNVIDDINNVENNKFQSVVNQIIMYCYLNITTKDIISFENFLDEMETYLVPFHNLSIDGDMRYNIGQWIDSLLLMLNTFGKNDMVVNIQMYATILDESDRNSRKTVSTNIYRYLNEEKAEIENKINKSQRYLEV